MRVLVIIRGRKGLAWVFGFFQASVFIVAISAVLKDLSNPLSLFGYAAGFATGIIVGMVIEERLAIGHIQVRIVSSRLGSAIADELRNAGFATTEIPARGKDGMVTTLSCSVLRRNIDQVREIASQVDPAAFITFQDVRPVRRGFWRA